MRVWNYLIKKLYLNQGNKKKIYEKKYEFIIIDLLIKLNEENYL